jgi:hypothetical protein
MKTSIFNMTFTLPPMVEMTEVEKEMPMATKWFGATFASDDWSGGCCGA